jgi:hypothetical protein
MRKNGLRVEGFSFTIRHSLFAIRRHFCPMSNGHHKSEGGVLNLESNHFDPSVFGRAN